MELTKQELYQTTGGAKKLTFGVIIGGVITLIIGIIDGYFRPLKCNS